LRLAELMGGLTLAADLVNGFPPEKVLKTALLAVEVGRRAGLDAGTLRDAYYLTLFRFLGCTGFAHEEAQYGAGDDITTRNVMALADSSEPAQTLRAIVTRIGGGARLRDRARAVAQLVFSSTAAREHAHAQCDVSVQLARLVQMSPAVVQAVSEVCERYDGKGVPHGVDGARLSGASKLLHLADVAEIACHRAGVDAALHWVARRSGRQLDPGLCQVFARHGRELLEGLSAGSVWPAFLAAEPAPQVLALGDQQANVALAFARFVDLKSVYTLDHSSRVAEIATRAGELAGLPPAPLAQLRLAAHLHDLGRVSVPNRIWDKTRPLDVTEWERVRLHAYYTERIVRRSRGWEGAAQICLAAHERLDGDGYHRGAAAATLGASERLLAAADVLGALLATRPQRAALTPAAARDVLLAEVRSGHLAASAVDAVLAALGGSAAPAPRRWPCQLSDREVEVLRLVATGKSNAEVGAILGISPRTVKNHVANVYGKIGVYSRAGAALFAVEHDLLAPQP
jgi:HD-GYP domain-containing protein (c-di-GMP phosphodiesterase class II)